MRLLFFSLWYFPEPVGKPHSLARELKALGHEITVVTGFPNYPEGRIYPGYRKSGMLSIERIDGIRVIRIRFIVDRSTSALKRILSMMSFSVSAFLISLLCWERYDAVWSYQIGLPGALYSFCTGTPHLHEVQDLWPAWGEGSLSGIGEALNRVLTAFQRSIYLQASAISTISAGFARTVSSVFRIAPSKIRILGNWADVSVFDRDSIAKMGREEFGLDGGFLVTYGGNVGTAQGLAALVAAAAGLKASGCRVAIAGEGVEKENLRRLARESGATNIVFLPGMSPRRMGALLSVSDILYIGLARGEKYEITIPSKTYACLAAGKPILAATRGDVSDLVLGVGAGLACEAENPAQIISVIESFMRMSDADLASMGERAHDAASRLFSGPAIAQQYEALFLSLV